jgi:hypothetical protein
MPDGSLYEDRFHLLVVTMGAALGDPFFRDGA